MKPLVGIPILAVLAALVTAQTDERAALLANPEYVEAAPPAFREVAPGELGESLRVVAARNFAAFGFNTPELQLHLPLLDNSTYAQIEMPGPRLFDATGADVAYELERGLHDAETQIAEVRFLAEGGDEPAAYARARGEIRVRYPLQVTTRTLAAGDEDEVVGIDGPYVEILEGHDVAEAPPFSRLEPIRAFDAEGRQLVRASYSSSRFENERSWRGLAFKGDVARVEVDSVALWAEVEIRYDVPIAPPLPQSRLGTAPRSQRDVAADPDARVEVDVEARPAASPAAAPGEPDSEGRVAIPAREQLSETARRLAAGLDALEALVPLPLSIVQLLASAPAMVSISLETPQGVREWTWHDGDLSGPRDLDTRWLECKSGMAGDAITLQRIPAIWDDATRRVGDGSPLQIVVGQYPCGVPFINVSFDGGRHVRYEADGRFVEME